MAKANSKKEAKFSTKQINALHLIGANIVKAETDTRTVFEAHMAAWGKSEAELLVIGAALDKEWNKAYDAIKAGGKLATNVKKAQREGIVEMSMRTAYNRRSDDTAVIKAFSASAAGETPNGMSAAEFRRQVEKLRDNGLKGGGSIRDALVMLCRAYTSKRAGKGGTNKGAAVTRIESAWKNKQSETLSKLKVQVQHAPLKALMVLANIIEERIKTIQKREKAEVLKLKRAA